MRKCILMFFSVSLLFILSSCGNKFDGKYTAVNKGGWISTIEVSGSYAKLDGISYPCEEKGGKLYITDPSKGAVDFVMVDNNTIKSDIFGAFRKGK